MNWVGTIDLMHLDEAGKVMFASVDIGRGSGLPSMLVTNYDGPRCKSVGSVDDYRSFSKDDVVMFSGTLVKPVRAADFPTYPKGDTWTITDICS